jgi:dipeptide/tripeptide permease
MHFFKLAIAHASQWLGYMHVRSILVLILVATMGFSDLQAFTAYSVMVALGDLIGLAGAYYGDKITGHHFTWLVGSGIIALGYMMPSVFGLAGKNEIIVALNLIACGIGISRCNGSSMVYSAINKEIPKEKQNSYLSIVYTIFGVASFIAYSMSGLINQKFGAAACFMVSGVIGIFSFLTFIYSEYAEIAQIKNLITKAFKLSICVVIALFAGMAMFEFYRIMNVLLWGTMLVTMSVILYQSHKSDSTYSDEERVNVVVFTFYMAWFIIYFTFERQFGMIVPLFIARHFDGMIFGVKIPVTNVMSWAFFVMMACSVIFFKSRIHDRLKNSHCLFLGFGMMLGGFAVFYLGSFFHKDYYLSLPLVLLSITLFALSDIFMMNRIFAICRVAPKRIHAITTAIMMLGCACAFHGARTIASFMAISKEQVHDRAYSFGVYQQGFLINLIGLSVAIAALIIIPRISKKANRMMDRIL